ncbi:hypothetical protein [Sphingomonas sp. URHD0057]|uniref:hypothetical protein n=1 Tax=Sphingomonas sp. URHD0057 TaxID=1380389 RepID=UPI00048B08A9|nr:hypothetical protein [Sphingomonas sp. URHD0057]
MSLRRCIPELQGQNKLSRDQADRARDLFEGLERDYAGFGPSAAEAMASEEAVKRLGAEAALKKRQAALQIKVQQGIAADVRRFRVDRPGAAAEALLASDDRAPYFNVEFREQAIAKEHFAMMNSILEKHSRSALGNVRDVASLHDVLREAFGENSGNAAARELAGAWLDTAESLRLHFNAAGGGIGKLDKWGMPQVHNMLAVRSVPFEQWRDFIAPLLDRERMQDATGNPMSAQQLELSLRAVYETISSDGWSDRRAGAFAGSKLANRHADSRFLIFKDADSWLAYSQRFGRPLSAISEKIDPGAPILDAMIGHVHGMSRDIALMQRLGPNPAATIRWVKDGLMIEATRAGRPAKRIKQAKASGIRLSNMYQELSGGFEIENEGLARFAGGVRAWESAAKLGGAVLSSTGDVATQYVTRRFNGLPALKAVSDYVGSLRPLSPSERAHAARQLHIAESATRTMGSYSRWTGETITGEIPARLANAEMNLSYLTKWTDDGHRLFNKQVWAAITDHADTQWSGLNSRFRGMFERYGLTERDWDTIRGTPLQEDGGAEWILPGDISDPALKTRLAEMILQEAEFAVPTSSLRVRSAINARFHRGSIPGEIGRTVLQFRGFPIQLFWMHGRRMLEAGAGRAIDYAASLFIASTVMGALATQLKQVTAGKDPLDMTTPDFWIKAAFQGGGLGIMGDFINSATARTGTDFWTTQAGPVAGTFDDLRRFLKLKKDPATGEFQVFSDHPGRAFRQLIQNNLPGSTLWYTRLAFTREVLDRLQAELDPDYYQSFDRMEKYAQQQGTQYYWRPGEAKPERSPDFKRAVGAQQ